MANLYTTTLEHFAYYVGSKEDLLGALTELGATDCDFNGENDCLWDKAKDSGCQSNMEYALAKSRQYDDPEYICYRFFDEWMAHDSYYAQWDYTLNPIGDTTYPLILSVAWITD